MEVNLFTSKLFWDFGTGFIVLHYIRYSDLLCVGGMKAWADRSIHNRNLKRNLE